MRQISFLCLILASLVLGACSTEIDINADEKDIWVVFGILDPEENEQYIRIQRGYLPTGDALEYAAENDLSAKGLIVTLEGAGKTYTAIQVDSVLKDPEDGTFYPYTTLYQFETEGTLALQPGQSYELTIQQPGDDVFSLKSTTTIPENVSFQRPTFTPGPGRERCLRQVDLVREYKTEFSAGAASGAFEIRAYLDYEENGVPKTAVYGPTPLFTNDVRCNSPGICYQFREKEILARLFNAIQPDPTNVYTYNVTNFTKCNERTDLLPDVFRFEVTTMDKNLANYRQANDPTIEDFNTVRSEFSNIEGPEDAEVLGLFGSITKTIAKARLNECGEALLLLNGTPRPQDCLDL